MADEKKKGKVECYELKDVHADLVSICTMGANGRTFDVFRVAGGRRRLTAEEKAVVTKALKEHREKTPAPEGAETKGDNAKPESEEEIPGVIARFLKSLGLGGGEKEDGMSTEKDKAPVTAEAVEKLTGTIEKLIGRIEQLEKGAETPPAESTPAHPAAAEKETPAPAAAPAAPTAPAEGGETKPGDAPPEKTVEEKYAELAERVESLAKSRVPSNALDGDNQETAGKKKASWKGVFLPQS